MSKRTVYEEKFKKKLNDEASPDYWDDIDASELMESAEEITPDPIRDKIVCEKCHSTNVRRRMIDLPIQKGGIVIDRVKILYCPDCKESMIEDEYVGDLKKRIERIGIEIELEQLKKLLKEGLREYDHRWIEKRKERKNITIYFPSEKEVPKKAQISIQITDPLYPVLRTLTSEDIRSILEIHTYEELQKKADEVSRSVSQFLKVKLTKRLLQDAQVDDDVVENDPENYIQSIILLPRKVNTARLEKTEQEPFMLAAKSEESNEVILLSSPSKEFVGVMGFDYENAELYIKVLNNTVDLSAFDIELYIDDKYFTTAKNKKIEDGRIVLLTGKEDISTDISKLILKFKKSA